MNGKQWLITLLTLATALIHLYLGVTQLGQPGFLSWAFILNAIGYVVLLVLYLRSSNRSTIRWIFIAYAALTIILYFVLNGGNALSNTIGLITKLIELLLIIMLFLDRSSDRVEVPAATAARTTTVEAGRAAGAAATGAGAAAVGAIAATDIEKRAGDRWDASAMDLTPDDTVGEALAEAGEAVVDAGEAAGAAVVGAVAGAADAMHDEGADLMAAIEAAEPTEEERRAELEAYLRSFGTTSEFFREIEYIEGIGQAYGAKLRAVGVDKPFELLVRGATRRGRQLLSKEADITESLILTWVNHVDLFRIKGVAQEYADLLEQSGVDTVVELAQRNPNNLHKRMLDVNEQKALVRRPPALSQVESWVAQAKELPRLIHY